MAPGDRQPAPGGAARSDPVTPVVRARREQAGWPSADEPQIHVRDYQPLLDRVVGGREFVFRLRASTVSSTRTPAAVTARQRDRLSTPRPRGVLIPARTAAHQLAWFERHLPS